FFFFQAEDGIRDLIVTGVQTCALPILKNRWDREPSSRAFLTQASVLFGQRQEGSGRGLPIPPVFQVLETSHESPLTDLSARADVASHLLRGGAILGKRSSPCQTFATAALCLTAWIAKGAPGDVFRDALCKQPRQRHPRCCRG